MYWSNISWQLRHTSLITQSLKEIHWGHETGLIDTGPLTSQRHGHKREHGQFSLCTYVRKFKHLLLCNQWSGFKWKINIFKIIDTCISFYSRNTHLLPPKPKSSFHYLWQGIQDFHNKYVLVPADKAANNVVIVWGLYYIDTLKCELIDTNAYKLYSSSSERVFVGGHCCHTALHFCVKTKENQDNVSPLFRLPKLQKKPFKARFIANSSSCTTTELSQLLTSCLQLSKTCFNATSLSTYDFSTLNTTLPHNLIKDKLNDLIERTFNREGSPYLACNDRNTIFTSMLWLFVGPSGFLLLRYLVLFTVESLSLLYLLVISWFICFRWWCIDKLGVFHANQISICLDPHLN